MKSYSCIACTRPARSGGIMLELHGWRCVGEVLDDLLAALVARLARASSVRRSIPAPLLVEDLVELLGDVVVDAAEVAVLELLAAGAGAAARASRARPMSSLAVAVLEALLEHPAQRGVEVAVVQQVVGHLREERVGVEVEADLRAVPPGVPEATLHRDDSTGLVGSESRRRSRADRRASRRRPGPDGFRTRRAGSRRCRGRSSRPSRGSRSSGPRRSPEMRSARTSRATA